MEKDYQRICRLPNGHNLYVKENGAGGRTYISDEVGDGVHVWDTCLIAESTLLACMTEEYRTAMEEYHEKRNRELGSEVKG